MIVSSLRKSYSVGICAYLGDGNGQIICRRKSGESAFFIQKSAVNGEVCVYESLFSVITDSASKQRSQFQDVADLSVYIVVRLTGFP